MRKVVIYGGRFQPMLKHHADVYAAIQRAFPDAEVYVATSDKTEPPKSPFNFQEKQSIITAHGIPADHVIRVTSPYSWQEYADKFDGTKTILIYAVGGKDTDRFKFNLDKDSGLNLKKDGTVAHVQPMEALKEEPKPMTERSYVYFIPTIMSDGEELSASKFREEFKNAPNLAAAKKLYTKQFGQYNEHVFNLILSKLKGNSPMTEHLNRLRALAGLDEAAPVHFGQDGDPAKAKFVAGSDSASGMSIANRFPAEADINDPRVKKEEFLKALVTSPAALLAEINARLDPKDHNSLQVGERLNEIISQLESSNGTLSTLSADDKNFAVALTANALKNMALTRGDTGAAPDAEEDLKDSFDLDELRVRAGIKEGFDDAMAFAEKRAIRAKDLKPYVGQTIVVWQEGHLNDPYESKLRIDSVTDTSVVINGESMPIRSLNDFVNYNAADDYMWKNEADADHYASIVDEDDEEDDDEPSTFKDEWGRDTQKQDQWKKNVTGKKNESMTEDQDSDKAQKLRDLIEDFIRNLEEMMLFSDIDVDRVVDALLKGNHVGKVIFDLIDYTVSNRHGARPEDLGHGMSRDYAAMLDELRMNIMRVLDQDMAESHTTDLQFNEEKLPMVKLSDIMADYGLTEASKPDFLDMDKDGNREEPMKKAIKDAEKESDDKEDETKESVEEHISNTSANAVQQALSELRKLAGL